MKLPKEYESRCCLAPSTTMVKVTFIAGDTGQRRCVRCAKPFFCRIDIDEDQEEVMRIRMVGEQRNQTLVEAGL